MNSSSSKSAQLGKGPAAMTAAPKVLVFDSGVGGLSIVDALRRRLPTCDFVFACDNAAFPYGTKEEPVLLRRVEIALHTLIAHERPDVVVIACNTASTLVLPLIRSRFTLPVVGVVPAIKPAAEQSQSRVIGLLGTPGTVARPYTDELIEEFAKDCQVVKVGSSELVMLAEAALRGSGPDDSTLKQIIEPFFSHPTLDTIVLACTHFPLLRDALENSAPRQVRWTDSGEAIARRVASLLGIEGNNLETDYPEVDNFKTGSFSSIFTSDATQHGVESLRPALKAMACSEIHYVLIQD
ncbi:MAG: glutamate racemase [Porticoccaceae bacterium]